MSEAPFLYRQTGRYFAQVAGGMEEMGAEELLELGATRAETTYRGVSFEAEPESLYRIVLSARLLSRVLAPLVRFKCPDSEALMREAGKIDWSLFFSVHQTFAIFAQTVNSQIDHSLYAAQVLKDAIVDQFRKNFYSRPSVDRKKPDVWFNLHIQNDQATISMDLGGGLHKRGYRRKQGEAPMRETLAAAIIRLSEWHGSMPLYDPFCGSGTLLCEALMHYYRIPAAYLRGSLGLPHLPDFDQVIFDRLRNTLKEGITPPKEKVRIAGSDRDFKAVSAAKTNLRQLPYGDHVKIKVSPFEDLPKIENSVIVSNPPFGVRLGEKGEITALYKRFGDFLKQSCQGSIAYIYVGDRELIPAIGLRPSRKIPLVNGALDGRLLKLEIY